MSADFQNSIKNAVSAGQISQNVADGLLERVDAIALAGCKGVQIADLDSEENTLVSVLLDASGSMLSVAGTVIDGYNNHFLRPLKSAKNSRSILSSLWVFSDDYSSTEKTRLIHGFTPIPDCPLLSKKEYSPDGQTPLYEAIDKAITGLVSYSQTLIDAGSRVKRIFVLFSDGAENASNRKYTANKIKDASTDLLNAENTILSYVFFGNQNEANDIAEKIGFPSHHRLTDQMDDSAIRRVFGQVSASVISASKSAISANISANAFFNS